jgi:hypothetical protein
MNTPPRSKSLPLARGAGALDVPEKIAAFRPDLSGLIEEGWVTLERVRVIAYRDNHPGGGRP